MDQNIYTIYDNKAKFYMTPFYSPNDDVAIRHFVDLINDEASQPFKHPDDYSLFNIGRFSSESGLIGSHPAVKLLKLGNDV